MVSPPPPPPARPHLDGLLAELRLRAQRLLPAPPPDWVAPWRGALLFVLPLPLLLAAVIALARGRIQTLAVEAGALALVMLAGVLLRRAWRFEQRLRQRRFASLPALSPRLLAGLLTALATGLVAALVVGHGLAASLAFALVALLGFHLAYGLVIPRAAPLLDPEDRRAQALSKTLGEAERQLIEIETSAASLRNAELSARLGRIATEGRAILELIAERPSDLYRARRFLQVYLEGVHQVTAGYARTHGRAGSPELEQNFRAVLITVEESFREQRERLLRTDLMDLDVRIEVLKKQLEHEGIV